jgi:hypothetical protein
MQLLQSWFVGASFGKCILDFYDPTAFVEMYKTLRVLNAVNHYEIGIPITIHFIALTLLLIPLVILLPQCCLLSTK